MDWIAEIFLLLLDVAVGIAALALLVGWPG